VSEGSPSNETGGFFASHPLLVPIVVVVVIAAVVLLWPRLKPRLLSFWHKAKQGAAIFSDRRRLREEVALPSGARSAAGSASTSFSWRRSAYLSPCFTVFLVASSHMLSSSSRSPPAGSVRPRPSTLRPLRRYASTHDIAAFSSRRTPSSPSGTWCSASRHAVGIRLQAVRALSKNRKQPPGGIRRLIRLRGRARRCRGGAQRIGSSSDCGSWLRPLPSCCRGSPYYGEVWGVGSRGFLEQLVALLLADAAEPATFAPPWMPLSRNLDFRRPVVVTQGIGLVVPRTSRPGGAAVAWPSPTRCCAAGASQPPGRPWPPL